MIACHLIAGQGYIKAEAQEAVVQGPEEVFLLGWRGDGVGREHHVRGLRIAGFVSKDTA